MWQKLRTNVQGTIFSDETLSSRFSKLSIPDSLHTCLLLQILSNGFNTALIYLYPMNLSVLCLIVDLVCLRLNCSYQVCNKFPNQNWTTLLTIYVSLSPTWLLSECKSKDNCQLTLSLSVHEDNQNFFSVIAHFKAKNSSMRAG